jgi:hypothetical protein
LVEIARSDALLSLSGSYLRARFGALLLLYLGISTALAQSKTFTVTVPVQIHIDGKTCTRKTRFVIPYVKWGLKDPSTFLLRVDKEVEMEIALVGQLSATTLQ